MRGTKTLGEKPRALRNEPFVTGKFTQNDDFDFDFVAYRKGEWAPRNLDPDQVLKPRLKGRVTDAPSGSTIHFGIGVLASARMFFALFTTSVVFGALFLGLAIPNGLQVPSLAFFSLLIGAMSLLFVRIPGVFGHPFRLNPDTCSGVFGHPERGRTRAFV